MELCTVKAPSKFPNHQTLSPYIHNTKQTNLITKPSLCFTLRQPLIAPATYGLRSRVAYFNSQLTKASSSEESFNGSNQYEKSDGVITLENSRPAEKEDLLYDAVASEGKNEVNEESAVGEEPNPLEFLEKLNVKLEADDSGSVVLVGAGGLVALWLASALVGAIESIPVVPKLMEVVGLSYTVWFSSRYLIFKKNRDELALKIQELKSQVLGSDEN